MTPQELKSFLASKMSISHVYQPAILLTLLENNGQASVQLVAKKCSELKGEPASMYEQKLVKYPKEALAKHGVIALTSRNEFALTTDIAHLSDDIKRDLIDVCKQRLANVK